MKKRWWQIAFVVILLCALSVRLVIWHNFDKFNGDEGNQLLSARHLFKYGEFFTVGETSTLDEETHTTISNSPINLYYQSVIVFLCGGSPRCYTLSYVVMSMTTCVLLFFAVQNLMNLSAAFMVLLTFSFASVAIYTSTWTAQPVSAIFLESLALFLFSVAVRKKSQTALLWCCFLAVLGLQVYEPSYLFLPVKLFLFWSFFPKLVREKKRFFSYLAGGIFLIYFPLILNEFRGWGTPVSNFYNLHIFLSHKNHASSVSNLRFFGTNLYGLPNFISYPLLQQSYVWTALFFGVVALTAYRAPAVRKKILLFFLTMFVPFFIVTFLKGKFVNEFGIYKRAYFELFIVYLPLLAGCLTYLHKSIVYRFVLMCIPVVIFGSTVVDICTSLMGIPLPVKEDVVAYIQEQAQERGVGVEDIRLQVINSSYDNNIGTWDNSIYWYLLEKNTDTRLVTIDQQYTFPHAVVEAPKVTFLICEYQNKRVKISECFERFEKAFYSPAPFVVHQKILNNQIVVVTLL